MGEAPPVFQVEYMGAGLHLIKAYHTVINSYIMHTNNIDEVFLMCVNFRFHCKILALTKGSGLIKLCMYS